MNHCSTKLQSLFDRTSAHVTRLDVWSLHNWLDKESMGDHSLNTFHSSETEDDEAKASLIKFPSNGREIAEVANSLSTFLPPEGKVEGKVMRPKSVSSSSFPPDRKMMRLRTAVSSSEK